MALTSMPLCRYPFPLRAPLVAAALAACVLLASPPSAAQQPSPGSGERPVERLSPPDKGDGLTAELFYKFILAEVALQRGELPLAAKAYYEAARESRDPRVARRATEIALASRQRGLAVESATLWAALDPEAARPKQVLASLAAGTTGKDIAENGADDEVRARLEKLLSEAAVSGQGVGEVFLQINRFFAQQPERRHVYDIVRSLAKPYPASPEAHFAIAYAALSAEIPASQGVDPALVRVLCPWATELRALDGTRCRSRADLATLLEGDG